MKLKYSINAATLRLTVEKCIGCGKCTEVCPHRVFKAGANRAVIVLAAGNAAKMEGALL